MSVTDHPLLQREAFEDEDFIFILELDNQKTDCNTELLRLTKETKLVSLLFNSHFVQKEQKCETTQELMSKGDLPAQSAAP